MPSLLDMPDVVMTNILEECGFKSVLNLRKVCQSLRSFVDAAIFKTDLAVIQIYIGLNGFSVNCENPDALLMNGICFGKNWTSNDLKIVLKLVENSTLSGFSVNTSSDNVGGFDKLEEILKNQTRPLQTESFEMEGSEILKVLPYLNPKTLKKISIGPAYYGAEDQILDGIEKVMELEQFRNAVELTIDFRFLVRADLRKFFHLQQLVVKLHETSLEELAALKEAFVASTHMECFHLDGLNLNENQLEQLFGTPFHDSLNEPGVSQWFFKIQNCKEHVLEIEWDIFDLTFFKLEAKEVPQDAVVHH